MSIQCECGYYFVPRATCCGFCEEERDRQERYAREAQEALAHRREVNRLAKQTFRERLEDRLAKSRAKSRAYYAKHKEEICKRKRARRAK